jgi:hypothetical protein
MFLLKKFIKKMLPGQGHRDILDGVRGLEIPLNALGRYLKLRPKEVPTIAIFACCSDGPTANPTHAVWTVLDRLDFSKDRTRETNNIIKESLSPYATDIQRNTDLRDFLRDQHILPNPPETSCTVQ